MCGIVGVLHRNGAPVTPEMLHRMTDVIAHRGPDGEGWFTDGALGLGHRRLAVIDLTEAARQPMGDVEGTFVLTYNGEVYNFKELRQELQRRGRRFFSQSDTEVVLQAYAEWGEDCVPRFNGMFAFALWDSRNRELFLARDRYGVKPLYYADLDDAFLFGSEIKALLEHPALRARVSLPHLLEYFTFQNILTDGTLFRDVRLLPPGHTLRVRSRTRALERRSYWDFHFREPDEPVAEADLEDQLDHLFGQAVRRQLVSDDKVGAYLSGGIDSGMITAIAAREVPYLLSFTVGFDLTSASGLELGFDEREKAETLSYLLKTEHYEVVLKAGDMERCLADLVWHLEDLRLGQSYPNFFAARLASRFVKSVLSGTGGDELFGGYPWRYYCADAPEDFDPYVEHYYKFWHRLLPNRYIQDLFVPEVWKEIRDLRTIDVFRETLRRTPGAPRNLPEYLSRSMYFEARTFLHGLLVVEDKLGMAHGLENRVPFLDNDLVDFAQQLPARLKVANLRDVPRLDENAPTLVKGRLLSSMTDGKRVLRKIMRRHIPVETRTERKQGFSGPDASWFRGESIEFVKSIVFRDDSRIYEFLRPELVRKLVGEHLEGKENRRLLLWSLLNFELWCRTFLNDGAHLR